MGAVRDRVEDGRVTRRRLGALRDDGARLGSFDGRRRCHRSRHVCVTAHLCERAGGGSEQSGRGP